MKSKVSILVLLCLLLFLISCGEDSKKEVLITPKSQDVPAETQEPAVVESAEEMAEEEPSEEPVKDVKKRIKGELRLSTIYNSPTNPIKGETTTIGLIVANDGQDDIESFDYIISIYNKDNVDSIEKTYKETLPAGDEASIKEGYVFKNTGTYQIDILVDSLNNFEESNELDNFKKDSVSVGAE